MSRFERLYEVSPGCWYARFDAIGTGGHDTALLAANTALGSAVAGKLANERERCARHIELIAADWRAAGADQKVWASEYLAKQIRELE